MLNKIFVVLGFYSLLLSFSMANELSCSICRGVVPSMQNSLKARRPIDVDGICAPFGEKNLEACLDFLTIYGQTILKRLSKGDEGVCETLYDRNLISVMMGSASYMCSSGADSEMESIQSDSPAVSSMQISNSDIQNSRNQIQQLNMILLLHIQMSQTTYTEQIENNQVTSSNAVIQESETTFFQDPHGDIWREDHTQIFKTDENSEQIAFLDLYSVAKLDTSSDLLDSFPFENEKFAQTDDDIILEMRTEKTSIFTERIRFPAKDHQLAFIAIQAITFLTLITAFMGVLYGLNNLPNGLQGKTPCQSEMDDSDESEMEDEVYEGEEYDSEKIVLTTENNEKQQQQQHFINEYQQQQMTMMNNQHKYDFPIFYPQTNLVSVNNNDAL